MQKVIVYTSTECTRCKTVKQMLNEHNVAYEEIVDNKQLMMEKDLCSVPAIETDGKIIDEYTGVLNWLRQNGYYSLSFLGGDEYEGD